MFFKKKKYETYGEGGLYEGVKEAVTSKIYGAKGCRIHVSQAEGQSVEIEVMNSNRVVKDFIVQGDKWIKVNGCGNYWVKAHNTKDKSLRVGLSIRSIE